jgi:hypothetical protein
MMLSLFNLGTPIISALKARLESKDGRDFINNTTTLPATHEDISDYTIDQFTVIILIQTQMAIRLHSNKVALHLPFYIE